MKDLYVILAFHAHELLWDLPGKLSYLEDENPMKETILDENYIKKRKEEGRDVYTLRYPAGRKARCAHLRKNTAMNCSSRSGGDSRDLE